MATQSRFLAHVAHTSCLRTRGCSCGRGDSDVDDQPDEKAQPAAYKSGSSKSQRGVLWGSGSNLFLEEDDEDAENSELGQGGEGAFATLGKSGFAGKSDFVGSRRSRGALSVYTCLEGRGRGGVAAALHSLQMPCI